MTNNEIQEQGQIEDQQPVMDDDYNNQGNLFRGNDNCLGAARSVVQVRQTALHNSFIKTLCNYEITNKLF